MIDLIINKGQSLWIVFAILFLGLATFHFLESVKKPVSKVKVKSISGVNLGTKEVFDELVIFIDDFNRNNRRMNIFAAISYIIAAITSIYSYHLSII